MLAKYLFILVYILSIGDIGYASSTNGDLTDQHVQPKSAPNKSLHSFQPLTEPSPENSTLQNPTGPLSLQKALSLGLRQSKELAAFSWKIRSAEARAIQAGLFPNPEIETSVENFGGENDQSGFKSAEITVQVNQTLELGGKRLKRKQAANPQTELTAWDYESKRLDLSAEISTAFWDVFAAQEHLEITHELARLSEETYLTVIERVKAGKVPPVESIQAEIALTTARIELEQARHSLVAARKRLSATWGSMNPTFETVTGQMDRTPPLPPLEEFEKGIAKNPDVARWTTEIENMSAIITLKDAEAIPDLTIGIGSCYSRETDDTAFVMALSLPIPLFNRNQGERQEARYDLLKAKEEQRTSEFKARTALGQVYQELSAAFLTTSALRDVAIPAAETAFKSTREGYREGKFSYPMVLEAQRTLFEVKRQHLLALEEYHKARITIERLTGQPAIGQSRS